MGDSGYRVNRDAGARHTHVRVPEGGLAAGERGTWITSGRPLVEHRYDARKHYEGVQKMRLMANELAAEKAKRA